jgi:hypothetical protein
MNSFLHASGIVLTMITFLVVLISMMGFFSISAADNITYICWFVALIIFYCILPTNYKYFNN